MKVVVVAAIKGNVSSAGDQKKIGHHIVDLPDHAFPVANAALDFFHRTLSFDDPSMINFWVKDDKHDIIHKDASIAAGATDFPAKIIDFEPTIWLYSKKELAEAVALDCHLVAEYEHGTSIVDCKVNTQTGQVYSAGVDDSLDYRDIGELEDEYISLYIEGLGGEYVFNIKYDEGDVYLTSKSLKRLKELSTPSANDFEERAEPVFSKAEDDKPQPNATKKSI